MSNSQTFCGPLDLYRPEFQFDATRVIQRESEIRFTFEWAEDGDRATIDGSARLLREGFYKSPRITYDSNREKGWCAVIYVLQAEMVSDGRLYLMGFYVEENAGGGGVWRFEKRLDPLR